MATEPKKKRNSILDLIIYPQRHMQFGLPVAACLPVCVCRTRAIFFSAVSRISIVSFANFWPNNISKKVSLLRPLLCLFMFSVINVFECNQTSMTDGHSKSRLVFILYTLFQIILHLQAVQYDNQALRFRANTFEKERETCMWLFSHLSIIKGL